MTALEIADRYWQQQTTSLRLDKALKLGERMKVSRDDVLVAIAEANQA